MAGCHVFFDTSNLKSNICEVHGFPSFSVIKLFYFPIVFFFQPTEDTENIDILPTAGMVAIIFKQFSIKSQLNKEIIENKTKNSRSRGHLASKS